MKIIHVINSMSTTSGGPTRTTLLTMQGTRALGMDITVLTNQPEPGEDAVSDDPSIRYLSNLGYKEKHWGYSKAISKELDKLGVADVLHIQGLWLYSSYITARFARRKGIPYVITLHGTLHPKALEYSSLIKKIFLFLYQRNQLQKADCIHATCKEEMEHFRALGFTNPVAVIPCPIEICEIERSLIDKKKKRVGYLGRIHPVKRVDLLLKVWKNLHEPGELLIMGDGEPTYVAFLQKEVERLQLSNIHFTGWVSGAEKNRLLASLTCLVVPSDFENFGMIIPEALLQEIPVIASTNTPWLDLQTYQCGWWVNNDVDSLTKAVQEALFLDEKDLQMMGKRGRLLILDKYSLDVVSQEMKQLYTWVAGQGDKPDFVYD